MNKSKHTGTKLSEYPTSLSNKKHKLLYNHFFMSYAPVNFGISTVNKNYKIPIQAIRDDIKYYIGLENAKGDWQNMIHFWSGDWINDDKTKSYIYEWKDEERGSADYISNKFGNNPNIQDDYDRIFFIKDAPIPLEEEHDDPNPFTNKFVNKKYIDDRFNGIRKITVKGETLAIRPYSCVYEFENTPTTINIVDTEELQDGRTVAECIKGNILTFIIKFNVGDSDILAIYANGEHNIKWSYPTEFQDIVKAAKENNNSDVWLQCYVGYTEQGLSIRCSSALHPMPGSHEPPKVTDDVICGDTKVPTADAVYHFVKKETHNITQGDFISFENIDYENEHDEPTKEDKVEEIKISVKTNTKIENDATTVPTTKAVHDSIEELIVSDEYDEIVFDLGDIFYEEIKNLSKDEDIDIEKHWAECMVILSKDDYYINSQITLPPDSLYIPNVKDYYPVDESKTLTITEEGDSFNIVEKGFDLSDVAKEALKTRLKFIKSSGLYEYEKIRLERDVPIKAQWVADAKEGKLKTPLGFIIDDDKTTEILRIFFYKLDQKHGKEWGKDGSYSKKYMVPGLTYKCITPANTHLYKSSSILEKNTYVHRTWLGSFNKSDNVEDEDENKEALSKPLINWYLTPDIIRFFSTTDYVHSYTSTDLFHEKASWDLTVSKVEFDKLVEEIQSLKFIEDAGEFLTVNDKTISVNTSSTIVDNDETLPTTKAVYDELEDIKGDMESLIVSDQYNDFVFDLSNIFYEQIQKENPYIEKVLILSGDEIEIPYKEKYYSNVGTLKITGISKENYENIIFTEEGQLKDVLSDVAKDAMTEKLILIAKNQSQEDLESYITKLEADVPYKATWIKNAKNNNIPTQLAFRHSSYRTNEILRMFFYYLDQEHGKEWGKDDSYSKKYMVPGLTYKCLTRPDTTFPTEQYYSYVYNIWLGDRGNTNRTLIAWNYKPSYLTIGSYPNESHGANWDGDSFTMPINWDTLVNEQAWDSFLKDYDTFKTTTEPHVANKEIHLTPEEKAQLFKTKFVITSKPDLTGSQSSGNVAGFVLEPTSDVKADKIVMKGISNLVSNILYIWKDTADGIITVLQNPNKSIVDGTTHTWEFNETLTFNANERYYFTWHNAVNPGAIAPPAPVESGHRPSVQKYSYVNGQIFALNSIQYFNSTNAVDRNNTVDCTFYVIDGVETVSPSTESVELISEDIEEIKKDIDEINSQITNFDTSFNNHDSNTTKHITDNERKSWNNTQTKLENIKSNYESSDSLLKSIIGNEDFVFNNYNPEIHTLGNHQGYMLVFTKKHFYSGKLLNIIIPHDAGGSGVKGGYLVIQVYKELNNESEIPVTYYSENQYDYIASSGGYRFNFENCVLNDYAKVHITFVKDKSVVPPYKPTTDTDYTKISKIRFQVIQKNGSEGEGNILGENDGCGVYWDNSGNLVDKLAHVAINKLAVKLVENYDFSEEEEETDNELKLVQETISLGESNINQDSNSNCYGITFIAQENATVDTLTIKTANSGYFTKVENLYAIIHEEQEDGTKKEIASMETPVNLSSRNTQYKLTFYPFAIEKDKKYFVEFIQKNTETGSFNDTRTMVNLGLINDTSSSGVLSQSSRSSWSVSYANQYFPILKLSQETYIMGNLALSNDIQYPLSLVAKINDEDASNIVLLKPFVTTSTDIEIESTTNGYNMGIILKKNENTSSGEHYLGIKTLYVDKATNEIKELLIHSLLTII